MNILQNLMNILQNFLNFLQYFEYFLAKFNEIFKNTKNLVLSLLGCFILKFIKPKNHAAENITKFRFAKFSCKIEREMEIGFLLVDNRFPFYREMSETI